jgi:hypothetical protein
LSQRWTLGAAFGGQAIQFGYEVLADHVAMYQAAEAVANFRTTRSELCLFLVVMISSNLAADIVGRKTLTTMDQLNWGQASSCPWNSAEPAERAIHPRPRVEVTAETPIRTRPGRHVARAKDPG